MLSILSVLVGVYSIHLIGTGNHVTGGLLLITDIICIMLGTSPVKREMQADDTRSQEPAPRQDERPDMHEINQSTPHVTADACERQEITSNPATDIPPAGSTAQAMDMLRALVDDVATGKGTRPPPSVYDRAAEAGSITVQKFLAHIAQQGGDVDKARNHAENVFCFGFNTYLDEENVDSRSHESCCELELAIMAWKSRNP